MRNDRLYDELYGAPARAWTPATALIKVAKKYYPEGLIVSSEYFARASRIIVAYALDQALRKLGVIKPYVYTFKPKWGMAVCDEEAGTLIKDMYDVDITKLKMLPPGSIYGVRYIQAPKHLVDPDNWTFTTHPLYCNEPYCNPTPQRTRTNAKATAAQHHKKRKTRRMPGM